MGGFAKSLHEIVYPFAIEINDMIVSLVNELIGTIKVSIAN